jgi:hypothetical protein
MLDSETARDLIRPHMPVVGADGGELPAVDHIEGRNSIALAKDESGIHHYIPLDWVSSVDDRVHLDHTRKEVEQEWSTKP